MLSSYYIAGNFGTMVVGSYMYTTGAHKHNEEEEGKGRSVTHPHEILFFFHGSLGTMLEQWCNTHGTN